VVFLFLPKEKGDMELYSLGIGLFVGFVLGAGSLLLYMRWKMMSQLNAMQQNMEGMFDMTDDLMDESLDANFEVEEDKEE